MLADGLAPGEVVYGQDKFLIASCYLMLLLSGGEGECRPTSARCVSCKAVSRALSFGLCSDTPNRLYVARATEARFEAKVYDTVVLVLERVLRVCVMFCILCV